MDLSQLSVEATTPSASQSRVTATQPVKHQPWKQLVRLQDPQNIRQKSPKAVFHNIRVLNELDTKGVSFNYQI